ncbi:hypothetical protein [Litorisediminicola beolgyonensis]|uniref:Helix-turn-helix domain-containing protein n=1 Tax=Litorisediminicola beolgyonensis TaxID=1173614 RepID=A0ABW3ZIN4_9RHOB
MHHARLSHSPRLRRALDVLKAAKGAVSTLELATKAQICAVNSVIAELRDNGAKISCRVETREGKRVFLYTLESAPEGSLE